ARHGPVGARGRARRVGALARRHARRARRGAREGLMSLHPSEVLIRPVISEKSYEQITQNQYTFRVHKDAHKTQVRQAVEQLFDVKVERVNIVKVQPKPKRRGLHKGVKPGWKKAVVQLRQGDSIEFLEGPHFWWPPHAHFARGGRLKTGASPRPRSPPWLPATNAPCVLALLGFRRPSARTAREVPTNADPPLQADVAGP